MRQIKRLNAAILPRHPCIVPVATVFISLTLALASAASAQHDSWTASQQSSPPATEAGPSTAVAGKAAPGKVGAAQSNQEFLNAADEVLEQMSQILDLPLKHPLKKSLRSREQIRALLIQEEKEDKNGAQRYADEKSLEAFGLVPRNFPLDSFMIDLLTDQVAGMYDPKAKEFYIADWIPIADQREVMAHEMTHALEDQSFHIEHWIKAARPNDDAEMARDSVSEGTAMAAMVDYLLRDEHEGVRDLPDVSALIGTGAIAEMTKDPVLAKAPQYIQDALIFPYLEGTSFSQQFLKAHTGWMDLKLLFEDPPVSTQQIFHPDLYLKGVKPMVVTLPKWKGIVPADWKLLEENVMGEFGLRELLKQFLGPGHAEPLGSDWAGDRYAVFENSQTGDTPLVFRLTLDSSDHAAQFFSDFSEALEKKYAARTNLHTKSGFLKFDTASGGVFLRCVAAECLDVEDATRDTFDAVDRAIGWTPAPIFNAAASAATGTERKGAVGVLPILGD
ncbi:MAG: hypothetical protein ACRD4X_02050 [Candidatus Acidiferrales bacterium]